MIHYSFEECLFLSIIIVLHWNKCFRYTVQDIEWPDIYFSLSILSSIFSYKVWYIKYDTQKKKIYIWQKKKEKSPKIQFFLFYLFYFIWFIFYYFFTNSQTLVWETLSYSLLHRQIYCIGKTFEELLFMNATYLAHVVRHSKPNNENTVKISSIEHKSRCLEECSSSSFSYSESEWWPGAFKLKNMTKICPIFQVPEMRVNNWWQNCHVWACYALQHALNMLHSYTVVLQMFCLRSKFNSL